MDTATKRQLMALVKVKAEPAILLRIAGITHRQIADAAGVSYPLAQRVASWPIDKPTEGEGCIRVRMAIQEALGLKLWKLVETTKTVPVRS